MRYHRTTLLAAVLFTVGACGSSPKPLVQTVPTDPAPPVQEAEQAPSSDERTEKYPNGQLRSQGKVVLLEGQEVPNGHWIHWYEDGTKAGELTYQQGKKNGSIRMWHPNGKPALSGSMKDDIPDGKMSTWYESGAQERIGHFQRGVPEGTSESWYESGQIQNRHSMRQGNPEGIDEGWHPNGKEMFRKNYKEGLMDGPATAWYDNGGKRWELQFSEGKLQGSYARWFPDGQKWFEGTYAGGRQEGVWKAFYRNGARRLEATFSQGQLTKQRCWSTSGKKETCRDDAALRLRNEYEYESKVPQSEVEKFGDMYLMRLSELKDRLCACSGDACVQDASDHMDKFAFEFQGLRPAPSAEVQLKSIGREIAACRRALGSEYRGLYKN